MHLKYIIFYTVKMFQNMKVEDVEDDTVNGHVKQKQKDEYKYEEDMNEKENEKDEKKKDAKPTETVGLLELFKFADKLDVFLIIIGIINKENKTCKYKF